MNPIPSWVWWIAGLLLITGGGVTAYQMTRGLRNNNPGNIRKSAEKWVGATVGNDPEFVTFVSPEYGIRAMAKVLLNYQQRYSIDTLRKLVYRWAPPSENDSLSYAKHVAEKVGVPLDTPINIETHLPKIIPALILHENGINPYSDATIRAGINLA